MKIKAVLASVILCASAQAAETVKNGFMLVGTGGNLSVFFKNHTLTDDGAQFSILAAWVSHGKTHYYVQSISKTACAKGYGVVTVANLSGIPLWANDVVTDGDTLADISAYLMCNFTSWAKN
jgi:hypothetical protein